MIETNNNIDNAMYQYNLDVSPVCGTSSYTSSVPISFFSYSTVSESSPTATSGLDSASKLGSSTTYYYLIDLLNILIILFN